jgi:hypothetical protein
MGLTQFLLAAPGTPQHVDAVFAQLDVDRSGTLSLAEFVNFYTQAEAQAAADGGRDAAAMAQFNALSGGLAYMDKSAFFNALGNMGLFAGLSPAQSLCRMNEQFPLADVDNRRACGRVGVGVVWCARVRERGSADALVCMCVRRVARAARSGVLDASEFYRYWRMVQALHNAPAGWRG